MTDITYLISSPVWVIKLITGWVMVTCLCYALCCCIGGQGPLGYVWVYVRELCNTWGLVSDIECGDCVPRAKLGYSTGAWPKIGTMSSSSGCSSLYWRFCVGAVGGSWMYAHSRSWCCNDKTLPDACYPRILLMLDQGTTARATGGVTDIYTWPLPVIRLWLW
jgi:hypothetical protein